MMRDFLKKWMLVIGMVSGAAVYLIYHSIPEIHHMGPSLDKIVSILQPCLLFLMLFLTFCKIEPRDLRFHKWQIWLLLIQGGLFTCLSGLLILFPEMGLRYSVEAAMLCLICPTATACAVVTYKLGGDTAGVLTYTILINLLVAIIVPLMVPLTNPIDGQNFTKASGMIIAKIFPMLIMPVLLAWLVRYFIPELHNELVKHTELAFYIWAFSLMLAIAMSTRYIVMNGNKPVQLVEIGIASLICCIFQFWAGKRIGAVYDSKITAGQSLGQKNTVFAIWLAYTFYNPLVSVVGGFYSIWHNCFNTWQLNRVNSRR